MTTIKLNYSALQRLIVIERPGTPATTITLTPDWSVYDIPLLDDAIENEALSSLSGLMMLTGGDQDVTIALGLPV